VKGGLREVLRMRPLPGVGVVDQKGPDLEVTADGGCARRRAGGPARTRATLSKGVALKCCDTAPSRGQERRWRGRWLETPLRKRDRPPETPGGGYFENHSRGAAIPPARRKISI
jgi:hypothetical protein